MAYWILKTEPETYSFGDLERDGSTCWDGVRNYQARNNLRGMRPGDKCLIYHSQTEKALVGIATVTRQSYQDPTTQDERWVAVDLQPVRRLARPVTLEELKTHPTLSTMVLVKQVRLSICPTTTLEWKAIVALSKTKLPPS